MKKLFALLIALMMVFSLAACDLGNTENPNSDNPGTSQSDENNKENNNDKSTNGDNQGGEESKDNQNTDRFAYFGLTEAGVLPDGVTNFEVTDNDDAYQYVIEFALPDGFSAEDYLSDLFDLTASVADDGNHKEVEGGTLLAPNLSSVTFDELMAADTPEMQVWYYKISGVIYRINVDAGSFGSSKCEVSLFRY